MELGYLIAASVLFAVVVCGLWLTPYRRIRRVKTLAEMVRIANSPLSLKASDAAMDWIQAHPDLVATLNSVEWRKFKEAAHRKSALATYAVQRRLEKFRAELQFCETPSDVLELVKLNAPIDRVMEFSALWRLDKLYADMRVRIAASVWGKMWHWTEEGHNSMSYQRWERAKEKVTLEKRENPA